MDGCLQMCCVNVNQNSRMLKISETSKLIEQKLCTKYRLMALYLHNIDVCYVEHKKLCRKCITKTLNYFKQTLKKNKSLFVSVWILTIVIMEWAETQFVLVLSIGKPILLPLQKYMYQYWHRSRQYMVVAFWTTFNFPFR